MNNQLVNLSFLINAGFVQSLLFGLFFLLILLCFMWAGAGAVILLLGLMAKHKKVGAVLLTSLVMFVSLFVVSGLLSVTLGPAQGVHCNYKQSELWIVEDRAAGKIWRAGDLWYHLVCGVVTDRDMFEGKRRWLQHGLLRASLPLLAALLIMMYVYLSCWRND